MKIEQDFDEENYLYELENFLQTQLIEIAIQCYSRY